jgi:hypothetical protein
MSEDLEKGSFADVFYRSILKPAEADRAPREGKNRLWASAGKSVDFRGLAVGYGVVQAVGGSLPRPRGRQNHVAALPVHRSRANRPLNKGGESGQPG